MFYQSGGNARGRAVGEGVGFYIRGGAFRVKSLQKGQHDPEV